MRFVGSSHKQDQLNGLRTRKQIVLFRQREAARREQAERREAEARVRHLNLDLIIRVVLFILAIPIAIAVIVGSTGNPALLKLSLAAASAWGVIAAGLVRILRPKPGDLRE